MQSKSIGIITFHHYYNYGTALQAYALQHVIEELGYSSSLIDYRAYEEKRMTKWQLIKLRSRRLLIYIKEFKRVYRLTHYKTLLASKEPAFDKFFEDFFITTKDTYINFVQLETNTPFFDIYCTGSDQTWSPLIGLNRAMFLEFAPEKARRISYAASLGVSYLSDDQRSLIHDKLISYSHISCRESSGTHLLRDVMREKEITTVLDPTLLIDSNGWDKVAETPKIPMPFVLCYFIGHADYYRKIAKDISSKMGIRLVYIPVSWRDLTEKNELLKGVGPREYLGLIRNAELILTDSFHGTLFSVNYHKNFFSFIKNSGGKRASDNSRIYDILDRLGLLDRLIEDGNEVVLNDIDYKKVDARLFDERARSYEYLAKALADD